MPSFHYSECLAGLTHAALRQRRIHFGIESGPVQDDCKESVEKKRDDEEVGEECCIACLSPSGIRANTMQNGIVPKE